MASDLDADGQPELVLSHGVGNAFDSSGGSATLRDVGLDSQTP